MSPKRKLLTVSLPPDMARKFDMLARGEGKNKSQLFREMFHTYEQQRLERQKRSSTLAAFHRTWSKSGKIWGLASMTRRCGKKV